MTPSNPSSSAPAHTDNHDAPTEVHHRPIKSYVLREGRMTDSQRHAIDELYPLYGIQSPDSLNWAHPTILEIGFGMGDSLIAMAQANPHLHYIGVEVHGPGVGAVLRQIHALPLRNLRLIQQDALQVLHQLIPDHALAGVQLYFPDPWPKKRHHKRRIVQPEFAELLRKKLCIGGTFHMATDWAPYAEHMMHVMSSAPGYRNRYGQGQYAPDRAGRIETKFERRGLTLGHDVFDLVFYTHE